MKKQTYEQIITFTVRYSKGCDGDNNTDCCGECSDSQVNEDECSCSDERCCECDCYECSNKPEARSWDWEGSIDSYLENEGLEVTHFVRIIQASPEREVSEE